MIDWGIKDKGFDWAYKFDDFIKENIENSNHENVINYQSLGETAKLAVPTPDHFNPILYILGAVDKEDKISIYNKSCMMGSLSMTSYLFTQMATDCVVWLYPNKKDH